MKKFISNALIALVFVLGLGLVCYPSLSNWYNEQVGSYSIQTYQEVMDNTPYETYEKLFAGARSYNATLNPTKPEYISGIATDPNYIDAFNLVHGMMGSLCIEKIDVNLPIYHGTDEGVLQTSVGHLEGSALPTGTLGEHTALTGHTGLPSATLLTNLTALAVGDRFEVHILNEIYTYEVFEISVVEPQEVDTLLPVADKNLVTLITCTPYGINSHRLFVQGELVSTTLVTPNLTADATPNTTPQQSNMPAWLQDAAMVTAKTIAENLRGVANAISAATVLWRGASVYQKGGLLGGMVLLLALLYLVWRKACNTPNRVGLGAANGTPKHYTTKKQTTKKAPLPHRPKHYSVPMR